MKVLINKEEVTEFCLDDVSHTTSNKAKSKKCSIDICTAAGPIQLVFDSAEKQREFLEHATMLMDVKDNPELIHSK